MKEVIVSKWNNCGTQTGRLNPMIALKISSLASGVVD